MHRRELLGVREEVLVAGRRRCSFSLAARVYLLRSKGKTKRVRKRAYKEHIMLGIRRDDVP